MGGLPVAYMLASKGIFENYKGLISIASLNAYAHLFLPDPCIL